MNIHVVSDFFFFFYSDEYLVYTSLDRSLMMLVEEVSGSGICGSKGVSIGLLLYIVKVLSRKIAPILCCHGVCHLPGPKWYYHQQNRSISDLAGESVLHLISSVTDYSEFLFHVLIGHLYFFLP